MKLTNVPKAVPPGDALYFRAGATMIVATSPDPAAPNYGRVCHWVVRAGRKSTTLKLADVELGTYDGGWHARTSEFWRLDRKGWHFLCRAAHEATRATVARELARAISISLSLQCVEWIEQPTDELVERCSR